MSLRDQPYLPLYVQDIMTDVKLNECSAATHGIYIKGLMCLMHKSNEYGKILLKQKNKQDESKSLNFARQLVKHLPYTIDEIATAIDELIYEKVCFYDGDYLCQKRMIRDNQISEARSKAGKKGGGNPNFVKTKTQTKTQTNSEYEYEYEDEDENNIDIDIKDNIDIKEKGVTGGKDVVPEETTNTPEATTPENKVSEDAYKDEFESFRKKYHGSKRGVITEFENFKKKHNDYQEVVFLLNPALEALRTWRDLKRAEGQFVPGYANLSTWINQRRWEVEHEKITPNGTFRKDTESEQRKHYISTEAARISSANA